MAYDPRFSLRSFDSLSPESKKEILSSMLEALVLADSLYLRELPETPDMYDANLVYQPEDFGDDDWRDIPSILDHGGGDCEDLASWRVAELRTRFGEYSAKPDIEWSIVEHPTEGPFTLYHIRVLRADGTIEDPSKLLGMQ